VYEKEAMLLSCFILFPDPDCITHPEPGRSDLKRTYPKWKDHPELKMSPGNRPDIEDFFYINNPRFAIIF
jgi:hypothetical protein